MGVGAVENPRQQTRVLIVDNLSASREGLAELLREEGYAVMTAPTRAAPRQLALHAADVVLVAVEVPGRDLQALLDELAAHRPGARPSS